MATFVFIENGKITPITRYGNIDKFVATIKGFTTTHPKAAKTKPKSVSLAQLVISNSVSYENMFSKFL